MGILRHSCPSYPVPDLPMERREKVFAVVTSSTQSTCLPSGAQETEV